MQDPNENLIVPFESENAARLADMTGIYQDLGFAADCLERLRAVREDDYVIARSLWTAALVAYARCFGSGKRYGLNPASVATLGEGAAELHQYLMDQRSKHIAHSVNPFEQTRIGAVLAPGDPRGRGVVGVATLSMSLFKPNAEELGTTEQLIRQLRMSVGRECQELTKTVQDEAKLAPIDELYGRERLALRAPGGEHAGRPRE